MLPANVATLDNIKDYKAFTKDSRIKSLLLSGSSWFWSGVFRWISDCWILWNQFWCFISILTVPVKGKNAHPFYKKLSYLTGSEPTWNFNKYLISKDGKSVKLFNSKVLPESNEFTEASQNFYKLIRKYFIRFVNREYSIIYYSRYCINFNF